MPEKNSKKNGRTKSPAQKKTTGKAVPLDAHIGLNLRRFRTLAGLSQEKLASEVNVTFQQIQKNENGKNRIAASRLYEFSRILGRDINDFFDGYDGNYKSEEVKFIHSLPPELKLLIQRISNIQDGKRRKSVIKALSDFAAALQDAE